MIVNSEGEQIKRRGAASPAKSKKKMKQTTKVIEAITDKVEEEAPEEERKKVKGIIWAPSKKKRITEKTNPRELGSSIPQKMPSKMFVQPLTEILQHASNNDKLSGDNKSRFLKARDHLMENKGNKQINNEIIKIYRDIYKQDIYKK